METDAVSKSRIPLFVDLDGTITDPSPGFLASVKYALCELQAEVPTDEELVTYIGPPLRGTFQILLETEDTNLIERAVELYRERLDNGGKFEAIVHSGMEAMLQRFSEDPRVALFVATGKPTGVAREIIEHFGLSKYFVEVYGAELDGKFADKSELLDHIARLHELPAGQGVMIGDTTFDIRAGRLHGVRTIGVSWGFGTEESMQAEGMDFYVSDVAALEDRISHCLSK